MISFENTDYFWWLLIFIPLIWIFILAVKRKKNIIQKLGSHRLVAKLIRNYSAKNFQIKFIVGAIAILLLIFAAINLQKPKDGAGEKKAGVDVMVALDVSKSMLSSDIKPTRLDKAKQVISALIDQLGDNRLGMVVFAGQSILQMPLTDDIGAAQMYADNANPDIIPLQGTEIGNALTVCNQAFNTGEKKYKAIVLISDGEDHDPKTDDALKLLKNSGVVVYTIGVGTPEGSTITEPGSNDVKLDKNGQPVISKLNQKELQNIAKATGGQYYLLDNNLQAPKEIATAINNMDKKLIDTGKMPGRKNFTDFFPYLIALAILLLVIELFIPERKRSLS